MELNDLIGEATVHDKKEILEVSMTKRWPKSVWHSLQDIDIRNHL